MGTMRMHRALFLICASAALPFPRLLADDAAPPATYDETELKQQYEDFVESLDIHKISTGYPAAVKKLLSGSPQKQVEAVKTLAETGEVEAIPWLIPFLDAGDAHLRIWTGSSLEKLVSASTLKRRDMRHPDRTVIKPLGPKDTDLRPLAWIVLKQFRKPDDGNTHAYAATMTRYLGLYMFERELKRCLESRHPAVSYKAKWALEELEQQKEYDKGASGPKQSRLIRVKFRELPDSDRRELELGKFDHKTDEANLAAKPRWQPVPVRDVPPEVVERAKNRSQQTAAAPWAFTGTVPRAFRAADGKYRICYIKKDPLRDSYWWEWYEFSPDGTLTKGARGSRPSKLKEPDPAKISSWHDE